MELRKLWYVATKWAWLIVLATSLAAVVSFVVSRASTPVYSTSTTILVNQAQNPAIPDYNSVLTSERLTQTYSQLLKTRPILEKAIQELGLSTTPDLMDKQITVGVIANTELIQLTVEDTNPAVARDFANTLARDFIADTQAQQLGASANAQKVLQQQITDLDTGIKSTTARLDQLRLSGGTQSTEAIQLQSLLSQQQVTYSELLKTQDDMHLAEVRVLDSLRVVEPAALPDQPVRPRILLNVLLAAVVGLLIGSGAVYLIEYLDDTVKTPEDALAAGGLTSLGMILRLSSSDVAAHRLVDELRSRSPVAEAYRILRTNVEFARVSHPATTILVTSANPSEGKTTTLVNLAIVMAESGKRVLAIDSDLRRPALHRMFALSNRRGLTNLLLEPDPDPASAIQPSRVENLGVITSGPIPPNPSELVGSDRMARLLEKLVGLADVIVLDSPPVLAVTDPTVLAARVDGVILVVDTGNTRRESLSRAQQTLTHGSAQILGVVLNKITSRSGGYYYYYYRDHYGHDPSTSNGSSNGVPRRRAEGAVTTPRRRSDVGANLVETLRRVVTRR